MWYDKVKFIDLMVYILEGANEKNTCSGGAGSLPSPGRRGSGTRKDGGSGEPPLPANRKKDGNPLNQGFSKKEEIR